jgi:Flp pilus assembly protein CpaB
LGSSELAVGRVARFPIAANEQVLLFKIVGTSVGEQDALTYVIEEGMRGLAINVEEVIGVGGLLLPGDHVDVLWVPFAGAPSFTLLSDVEVTAVSQAILDVPAVAPGLQGEEQEGGAAATADEVDGQRTRASEAELQPDALTVTLMVSAEQMNTLLCAEAYALENNGYVRLALRSFGDTTPATVDAPACPPIELLLETLLALEARQ